MSNDNWIDTDPFGVEYKFYETAIVGMAAQFAKARSKAQAVYTKKPTNIIVKSQELTYGEILMPPDCVPYDPNNPAGPGTWDPKIVEALIAKTSIPPVLFPEAFGAIVRAQTDVWYLLREHAHFERAKAEVAVLPYEWVSSTYDEEKEVLTPNHKIMRKAKNVVIDNAKTETIRVSGTGTLIPNTLVEAELFAGYNSTGLTVVQKNSDGTTITLIPLDRCTESPNGLKDIHQLHEQNLPILLKAHPRYPTSFQNQAVFELTVSDPTDPSCETSLDVLVPASKGQAFGSDLIKYVGSDGKPIIRGSGPNKDLGYDTEAHCRCYIDVAMMLPDKNEVVETWADEGGHCIADEIYEDWSFKFMQFLRGDCLITQAYDPVTYVQTVDGMDELDVDILHVWKMTVFVADLFENDDFESHFFCGIPPESETPPTPLSTPEAIATPITEEFHRMIGPVPGQTP